MVSLYTRLTLSPELRAHCRAFGARRPACRALLQLAQRALAVAAVALQLPANRRGCTDACMDATKAACTLAADGPVWQHLAEQLCTGSNFAAAFIKVAVQLVQLVPAGLGGSSPSDSARMLFDRLSVLLADAARICLLAGTQQQQRCTAQQLMSALPGLQAWAQCLVSEPRLADNVAVRCCGSWLRLADALDNWAGQLDACNPADTPAEEVASHLQALCWAGTAVMSCLPAVLQLGQQAQQGPQAQEWCEATNSLGDSLAQMVSKCAIRAQYWLRLAEGGATEESTGSVLAAEQLAACLPAVHMLHTTACRAVHWLLGLPADERTRELQLPSLRLLVVAVNSAFYIVVGTNAGAETERWAGLRALVAGLPVCRSEASPLLLHWKPALPRRLERPVAAAHVEVFNGLAALGVLEHILSEMPVVAALTSEELACAARYIPLAATQWACSGSPLEIARACAPQVCDSVLAKPTAFSALHSKA